MLTNIYWAYYIIALNDVHEPNHLILRTVPYSRFYFQPHFVDKETETQIG